ncbi:hypothetical protein FOA43_001778 [Brettanomyces nanus]|uniref:Zn(2)-C6 fungal-type domain-containing protein n=1 Tax=Eeniella nana TaxID=13502 RepID=A0A875S3U5_EENNA|nr:uncharacterized protein FOA43_001778 [Brettanomyces nanus]QPG74449.1 hypothetical protein FOA43_001778 [Brettanomyces nanus]
MTTDSGFDTKLLHSSSDTSKAPKVKARRHRLALSCSICRQRKVKCDRERPHCKACERYHVTHLCSYDEPSWIYSNGRRVRNNDKDESAEIVDGGSEVLSGGIGEDAAGIKRRRSSGSVSASSSGSGSALDEPSYLPGYPGRHMPIITAVGSNERSAQDTKRDESVLSELQILKDKIKLLETSVAKIEPSEAPSNFSSIVHSRPLPPILPHNLGTPELRKWSLPPPLTSHGSFYAPQSPYPQSGLATRQGSFSGFSSLRPVVPVPPLASLTSPMASPISQPRPTLVSSQLPCSDLYADPSRKGLLYDYLGIEADDRIDFYAGCFPTLTKCSRINNHGPLSWVSLILKDYYSRPIISKIIKYKKKYGAALFAGNSRESCLRSVLGSDKTSREAEFKRREFSNPTCPVLGENLSYSKQKWSPERPPDSPRINPSELSLSTKRDAETTIIEGILDVLPVKKMIWLLVERFFQYVYPFSPYLDETRFVSDIEAIIGPKSLAEEKVTTVHMERKLDFSVMGSLLIALKMAYLSLSGNYEAADDYPQRTPNEMYLLSHPLDEKIINVAQLCLNQFKLLRRSTMSIFQCAFLMRDYQKLDGYDGFCDGDSQVFTGLLVQMGISIGLNRDPDNFDFSVGTDRMKSSWRKLWYCLIATDMTQCTVMGDPRIVSDDIYDTKLPVFSKLDFNNNDLDIEGETVLAIRERFELGQEMNKVVQLAASLKGSPVVLELLPKLDRLERIIKLKWESLSSLLTPTDGNHIHNIHKMQQIMLYAEAVSLLHPIYHHLILFYEKKGTFRAARKFTMKSVEFLMEIHANFENLVKRSYRYVGTGFDFVFTPVLEVFIHKCLHLQLSLYLRSSSLEARLCEAPQNDEIVEVIKKFKKTILIKNIKEKYICAMSILAGKYFYAWRMTKAHTLILKVLEDGLATLTGADEPNNFLSGMGKDELVELFELVNIENYVNGTSGVKNIARKRVLTEAEDVSLDENSRMNSFSDYSVPKGPSGFPLAVATSANSSNSATSTTSATSGAPDLSAMSHSSPESSPRTVDPLNSVYTPSIVDPTDKNIDNFWAKMFYKNTESGDLNLDSLFAEFTSFDNNSFDLFNGNLAGQDGVDYKSGAGMWEGSESNAAANVSGPDGSNGPNGPNGSADSELGITLQAISPRNVLVDKAIFDIICPAGLIASSDFRHGLVDSYLVGERVGVVTVATVRCFGLYLRTLKKKYSSDAEYEEAFHRTHKKAAEITLHSLRKNGGIYIKIGQHLGAMTYLLPFEWTDTMVPLQDECPQSSLEDIKEMFEKDTGVKMDDYFSEFDPIPIGTASLAQVHVARLKSNGTQVAVKVEHPSLAKFVPLDVWLTKTVFDLMYKVFPEYPLTWLGDELQSSIYVELDFRNEARNAQKTDEYFRPYHRLTALRIPKVYASKQRILIMEYVGGARLDNLHYIDSHGISRAEVSSCIAHIFNNMIFQSGFVHCDPHHGNLAIRALEHPVDGHNFEIVLYDHGLYRTIPYNMKVSYAKFWLAMLDKNPKVMRKYGKQFAQIDDGKYPILAAALTGRDFKHATSGDIDSERSQEEIENMRGMLLQDHLILDLMALLASVPKIVLLILKTNDLVRHLDESLHNPLGNERTFFIMATYCAHTVLEDDKACNSRDHGRWSLIWCFNELKALSKYYNRSFQLRLFDLMFYIKNLSHRFMF